VYIKYTHCSLGNPSTSQAKREVAKKEGRLLTKKQKEEKQMAEIRKQALLASGVQIEGLQASGSGAGAPKKVVYGNRKKKGPVTKDASPAPESRPTTPEPVVAPTPPPAEKAPAAADEPKDDWDASSDEEAKPAVAEGVKGDWDASSGEEEEEAPAPATAPAPTPTEKKSTPAPKGEPVTIFPSTNN
jgi:translation initiation factor 5B